MDILIHIFQESIMDDVDYEEQLLEVVMNFVLNLKAGFHLLAKLLMVLDITQVSQQNIDKIGNIIHIICNFVPNRHDYLCLWVVIGLGCLFTGNETLSKILAQNLVNLVQTLLKEIKESAMTYIFDMVEGFLIIFPQHRREFGYMIIEKVNFNCMSSWNRLLFISLKKVTSRIIYFKIC
jgi:hypothetical protein